MDKEKLFELIRREEVVLFAGAGLSRYAGYPSGKALTKIIYEDLSKSEKREISSKNSLSKLTKDYSNLKDGNRDRLISLLKQIFVETKPKSIDTHNLIARIPHFNDIITTNYDNLFEIAFENNLNKYLQSEDLPIHNKNLVNFYKIHGDLSRPDSIIISDDDYSLKYFTDQTNNEYWGAIKNYFITKNIVFIGYNLDDPNIYSIFRVISDKFKNVMRKAYFIAPDLENLKLRELSSLNIEYVNNSGENFILELNKNIESNITFDLDNGVTRIETVNKYLNGYGLQLKVQNVAGHFKFKNLLKSDGETSAKLNLKIDKKDDDFYQEFKNFTEGKKFGSLDIGKHVINFDLRTEGIRHPIILDENFKLIFESSPNLTTLIDSRFKNGFDFNDIPVKIYSSKYLTEVNAVLNKISFKIILKPSNSNIDVNFEFDRIDKSHTNVNDELKSYFFMTYLFSGIEFELFRYSKKEFSYSLPEYPEIVKRTKKFVSYLEDLKLVEQYFSIQFKNFKITDSSYNVLRKVVSKIKKNPIIYDNNYNLEFKYKLKHKTQKEKILIALQHDNCRITSGQKDEVVNLHGTDLNLGTSEIIYFDPKLVDNCDIDDNMIVCKCKKIQVTYM